MVDLDPFNPFVAGGEMLLLLATAALVGWLVARIFLNGRVNALRRSIAAKETELADCRRAKAPLVRAPLGEPTPDPAIPPADELTTRTTGVVSEPPSMPATGTPMLEVPVQLPPIVEPLVLPALPVSPATPSEEDVLSRIAARAGEIDLARIGRATAAQADDLKDIVGIGPFLERKLHAVGLYTFRQISAFTTEDAAKINEIIEFFPGRIERDDWVGQARHAHERKYGTNAARM